MGILLDNVNVQFRGTSQPVLDRICLELEAGRITAILGPSGCGKSTLLRIIAGLLKPTSGNVRFVSKGQNVDATRSEDVAIQPGNLGYVFQDAALLPWRSVLANTTLPMELLGLHSGEQRRGLAAEQLTAVGLKTDDFRKLPAELSGGMRMRVSIARALATNPSVLLLDEPFSALDDILRTRLGEMVVNLWRQHPRTVIMVTHNIAEAILLSQRILVMGQGIIASDIEVDLPVVQGEDQRASNAFAKLYAHVSSVLRSASVDNSFAKV